MKKFLKKFDNEYAKNINIPLVKREIEKPLVDFIVEIFQSLEVTRMIKLLSWDHITDESKIDYSNYIVTRTKNKQNVGKKKDDVRYMYTHYDRCTELIMKFKFSVKGQEAYKTIKILLPRKDENNYYHIRGKNYFLLYQLVDNSTYNTKNCLTLKGLMPLCIGRENASIKDTNGTVYNVPSYIVHIFKRKINPLLFYFSKIGFTSTLEFFNINELIKVVSIDSMEEEKNVYFIANKHIKLSVNKMMFDKHQYVKTMTCMIMNTMNIDKMPKDSDEENIIDKSYWVKRLGSLYTTNKYKSYDMGKSTLVFFERLLDGNTRNILKLYDSNKNTIYSVAKWMIQNFNELKKKDNMDLVNKRLRLNEYIGSILSKRLGDSINGILSMGNRVELENVIRRFNIHANVIFKLLYKSSIISYDDRVNDLDFFSSLKFTVKGPNSIGMKTDRNVSIKNRAIHPSFLGRLDLDVCSSSSPGLGGLISPFAKTDKLFFDTSMEVQDQVYDVIKDTEKILMDGCETYVDISSENYDEYVKNSERLKNNTKDALRIIERDDCIYIYIDEDEI